MAINKISGNILQDDLVRGSNLAIQGNLIYFDVANDRVGILTSTPGDEFTVNGVANAANVRVTSATANGIFYASADLLAITSGNLTYDGTGLTVIGNLTANVANITQTLTVTGNITAGNIASNNDITAVGNVSANNATITNEISTDSITANVANIGSITLDDLNVGNIIANGYANITGNVTGGNFLTSNSVIAGNFQFNSALNNAVVYTDSSNTLTTSSNLTFDGATLSVTGNLVVDDIEINGNSITSNATLEIQTQNDGNIVLTPDGIGLVQIDTSTGLTIPVGNTAQRPGTPDTGTIRWNTSLNIVEVYNGADWEGVGQDLAIITDQTITGDGANTVFVLDQTTTANAIIVSTNGVVQRPGVAYTVTGNSITFAEAPQTTDIIDVRFIAELSFVNAISNDSGINEISVDPSGVANLSTVQSLQLPSYTVTQATALANVANGQIIYVSNGDSGQPCLAVYSVNAWKVVSLGGNIST
jgi:hypothetical protein